MPSARSGGISHRLLNPGSRGRGSRHERRSSCEAALGQHCQSLTKPTLPCSPRGRLPPAALCGSGFLPADVPTLGSPPWPGPPGRHPAAGGTGRGQAAREGLPRPSSPIGARTAPTAPRRAVGPGREGVTRTFRGRGRTLASARSCQCLRPAPPGSGETADMTHFNKGPSYGLSAEVKNKVRGAAAAARGSTGLCLHQAGGGGTRCDVGVRCLQLPTGIPAWTWHGKGAPAGGRRSALFSVAPLGKLVAASGAGAVVRPVCRDACSPSWVLSPGGGRERRWGL